MTTLAARVRDGSGATKSVDEALQRMRAIQAERRGMRAKNPQASKWTDKLPDGVACFNTLYTIVTERVGAHVRRPTSGVASFERPDFVKRLMPIFADFYLEAYRAARAKEWTPRSWRPLFNYSNNASVMSLGFAAGGMNAHINHDLSYALVQVWDEVGKYPGDKSLEYRDFLKVNEILVHVKDDIKPALVDSEVKRWDAALGDFDDKWVMGVVRRDRAEAWRDAKDMYKQRKSVRTPAGARLRDFDTLAHSWRDRQVGAQTMSLLLPKIRFP